MSIANIRPALAYIGDSICEQRAAEMKAAANSLHWNACQGLAVIGRMLSAIECCDETKRSVNMDELFGLGSLIETLATIADESKDIEEEAEYTLSKKDEAGVEQRRSA